MKETHTIEIHFTNGEKLQIPDAINWWYEKTAEMNYTFVVQRNNHNDYFPAENVNAIGKAGDFK